MKNFFLALGLLFIGLKLTNHLDWSWWLVLLPLYGPLAVYVGAWTIGVLFAAFVYWRASPEGRRIIEAQQSMRAMRDHFADRK